MSGAPDPPAVWDGGVLSTGAETGPVTSELRQALLDVDSGRAVDSYGWVHRIV